MAMMNCAAQLVAEGKKVLVADFDLEAPGLDTFKLKKFRGNKKGIVEYVTEYLSTDRAPGICDYIHKCSFSESDSGELWIMPAGNRNKSYHKRLNTIDWRHLYDQRDGFLLFENLKAQWKKYFKPDYILIDSRTGHTDISGICTRQLPDAVVILFFPNEQNLSGLVPIVERIRIESKKQSKNTRLHFVTSNVPDIDDEHSILGKRLQAFRKNLKYEDPTTTVHHYPSLSLLDQEIFIVSRPKSRLASEYRTLVEVIQKDNPQDRKGVLLFLGEERKYRLGKSSHHMRRRSTLDDIDQRIRQFLIHHHNDSEIVEHLVSLKEMGGQFEEATQILEQILKDAPDNSSLLVKKARLAYRLEQQDLAVDTAIAATNLEELSYNELDEIVRLLISSSPSAIDSIHSWPSIRKLQWMELFRISQTLSDKRKFLAKAEQLIQISRDKMNDEDYKLENQLLVNLIGQRKFKNAFKFAEKLDIRGYERAIAFNLAMAKWGYTQQIPLEDFKLVMKTPIKDEGDANYMQCMSLVYWVLKEKEQASNWLAKAKREIKSVPLRTFSCWSYLSLNSSTFLEDLKDQEKMINGEKILPSIFDPIYCKSGDIMKNLFENIEFNDTDSLRSIGFGGFLPVSTLKLKESLDTVPFRPGVYLVLNPTQEKPEFLKKSVGGHFKGNNPTVNLGYLEKNWVDDGTILYAGETERTLYERVSELIGFGSGEPRPHRGGRLIWQLKNHDELLICWRVHENPVDMKHQIIKEFKNKYNALPFANLQEPT